MDKDLEYLKQSWREMDRVADIDGGDFRNCMKPTMFSTYRRKLLRSYTGLVVISGIYIVLGPLCIWPMGFPVWITVWLSVYFGLMCVLSFRVRDKLLELDFGRMNVMEALACVDKILRMRRMSQWVGMVAMVPLMVCLLWYMYGIDVSLFVGGVVGGVVGVVIGLVTDMRMRRMLNEIRTALGNMLEDENG